MVSFTLQPLYPRRCWLLSTMDSGVLDSSKEGNLWPLPEVEGRFVSYPARSVVNTLTKLSPFLIQYDACNYLTAAAKWSSFNGQQVQMSILTTSCGHPIGSTIKCMASCHTKQWRCVTRRQAACYHTQLSIPLLAYGFVTQLSYCGLKRQIKMISLRNFGPVCYKEFSTRRS